MLRSSLRRPLGRQVTAWRSLQRRPYSTEQRPERPLKEVKEAPPAATSESTIFHQPAPTPVTNNDSGSAASFETTSPPPTPEPKPKPTFPEEKVETPTATAVELERVKQLIREWTEQTAIVVRKRADEWTALTKTRFSQLGRDLNKVTGYNEIDALKRGVVEQENRINDARHEARKAKEVHEQAILQRAQSQREVNDLLQRKSMWTDGDVGRFTTLVRQDHLYEQEEARAKAAVVSTEDAVDKEFSELMRLILARYHEEQVWSDKIRSASTYGQLAALGLNLLVFLLAIVLVEPWKRKRLAQTFERKVEELSADYALKLEQNMSHIQNALVGQEALLLAVAQQVADAAENLAPPPYEAEPAPETPLPPPEEKVEEVEEEEVEEAAPEQEPEEPWTLPLKSPTDHLNQRQWELALVGTGAFVVGMIGTLLLGR